MHLAILPAMAFLAMVTRSTAAAVAATTTTTTCLVDDGIAAKIASNFGTLFSAYTEAFANKSLAVDVTDQTDSVMWLINNGTNCPDTLGTQTFSNRRQFELAQGSQPNITFVQLNVLHDCNNVIVRWKFDLKPQQVQGISILGVVAAQAPQFPYVIKSVLTEFNSGAFAIDFGVIAGNRISPAGQCAS